MNGPERERGVASRLRVGGSGRLQTSTYTRPMASGRQLPAVGRLIKDAALPRARRYPWQREGEARCWRLASALSGLSACSPSNERGERAGNGRADLPRKRHEQARRADRLGAQLGHPEQIREMAPSPFAMRAMLVRDGFRRPFSTPPMKLGVSSATSAKASRSSRAPYGGA